MLYATNGFILIKKYTELKGKITPTYVWLSLVHFSRSGTILGPRQYISFFLWSFPVSFSLSFLLRPSNLSPFFLQLPPLLSLHWQAGEKWDLERHFLSLLVFRRVLRWDLIQPYSNYIAIEKYFFLYCGMKQILSQKDHRKDKEFCSGQKTLVGLTIFADYIIIRSWFFNWQYNKQETLHFPSYYLYDLDYQNISSYS
jgi:hypothetical protein